VPVGRISRLFHMEHRVVVSETSASIETTEFLSTDGKNPCDLFCPVCGDAFLLLKYVAAFEESGQSPLLAQCRCGLAFRIEALCKGSPPNPEALPLSCAKCGSREVLARGWRARALSHQRTHGTRLCCLCKFSWTIEASPASESTRLNAASFATDAVACDQPCDDTAISSSDAVPASNETRAWLARLFRRLGQLRNRNG
jgi:hypothetical protein